MPLDDNQIDNLIKKGLSLEKVNRYEKSIYLLQNLTNTLVQDYDDYMKKFGLRGGISNASTTVKRALETYLKSVRKVIPEKEQLTFLMDYESLERDFRERAGLVEDKLSDEERSANFRRDNL